MEIVTSLSVTDLEGIIERSVNRAINSPVNPQQDKDDNILITSKEAQKMLGVKSHNTIRSMWQRGDIVMRMVMGRPRILKSSVNEYIKNVRRG